MIKQSTLSRPRTPATGSYWDFHLGFGLLLTVNLLIQAGLVWYLATLIKTNSVIVRPVLGLLFSLLRGDDDRGLEVPLCWSGNSPSTYRHMSRIVFRYLGGSTTGNPQRLKSFLLRQSFRNIHLGQREFIFRA